MQPPSTPKAVSRETTITIGFAVFLAGLALWNDRRLSGIEHEMGLMRRDVQAVTVATDVDSLLRVRSFGLWAELLAARNPTMVIPPMPR